MNAQLTAAVLLVSLLALAPTNGFARGFGGGGGGFDRGGGDFDRGGGGGFDFHHDGAPSGGGYSHSSTGPAGTSRTTTASESGGSATRSTTATNGDATRTATGTVSEGGNYQHNSTGSDAYGYHSSATSGNTYTGNYNHSATGNNPYGSYNTSGSGNTHTNTYYGSGTATNQYGTTYHTATSYNNGYVYHGAAVSNPMYYGYPAWGWNAGVAWYPAPIYYGGAFWGAYAAGAATAIAFGSVVAANNVTITSYQVTPQSPGAKLLASYKLTQTECGPPNIVVIYGPNNSVICAQPNQLVAAGHYSIDTSTLTIVSEKAAADAPAGVAPAPIAGSGSPLTAMPVGATRNYHVTTQKVSRDGSSPTSNFVRITRSAPALYSVSVDGAPAVDLTPGGVIPPAIKKTLGPFIVMSLLMHAAPQPVAANSAWGATLPVYVDPDTDTVPVSVSVSRLSSTGATVTAAGQTSAEASPGIRDFPATISVNATLFFNQNHELSQGSGSVSVVVHKRAGRTDKVSNNWTVSPA